VGLDWRRAEHGARYRGFDGAFLVGLVVRHEDTVPAHWQANVRGYPLPGAPRFATADDAMAAVDRARQRVEV
jgi:hypothetical protein